MSVNDHNTMPSMQQIAERQNSDLNLRRQVAKGHYYDAAARYHIVGSGVAIALALVSPVVLFLKPDLGPTLGAVAGVWIFLSRILLEPLAQGRQFMGAAVQELFDCSVLGLSWNIALARRPGDEEVRRASKAVDKGKSLDGQRDWYPASVNQPWPSSVLTCQRSNAVWARRQHKAYAWLLRGGAVGWALIGIGIAISHDASLAQYLTTIALPSLPAILDAAELSKRHLEASGQRERLQEAIESLSSSEVVAADQLREVQDQIFELRRKAPAVARWFYRVIRTGYEQDMVFAAEQAAEGKE